MLEFMKRTAKQYEVKAMADAIIKESSILQARAIAIQKISENEKDPLKMIENCAEVTMITKLVDALESMSEETVLEAEKLGMIEK